MNEGAEDTIERAGPVADARALRAGLVDGLRNRAVIHSNEVENAFRKVARQAFLPDVSLEAAYADDAVVTKRDANGVAISSVSAPSIVALMLERSRYDGGIECWKSARAATTPHCWPNWWVKTGT